MNVDIIDLSPVKKKITVKFPQEEVLPKVKKELSQIGRVAKIKGFRQGKAPMSLVEKLYMEDARKKFAENAIKESLLEIINNNNLDIAVRPVVEKEEFTEEGFVYDAVVETHPVVKLEKYKGFEFKKPKVEAKDEEIENKIAEIKEKHVSYEETEEDVSAGEDHVVNFDVLNYNLDGKEQGESLNQEIDLSKETIFKEIKEAILGLKKNEEKEFSFIYPQDIENEKLRGKEAKLKIKINAIKRKKQPTDEELIKIIGKESIEQLRSEISASIISSKQKDADERFKKEVFDKIYAENPFEIPVGLRDEVAFEMLQSFAKSIEQAGLDPNAMGFEWDKIFESYRAQADDFLKRQYIIKAIKQAENIDISDDELNSIINSMVEKSYNKEKLMQYYSKPEAKRNIYLKEIENRVFDFLVKNNMVVEE